MARTPSSLSCVQVQNHTHKLVGLDLFQARYGNYRIAYKVLGESLIVLSIAMHSPIWSKFARQNPQVAQCVDQMPPEEVESILELRKEPLDLSQLEKKEFLSLDEVAAICGVSKRTIEKYVANGGLSSVKFGGRKVTRAQLETFIRALEIRHEFSRPKGF